MRKLGFAVAVCAAVVVFVGPAGWKWDRAAVALAADDVSAACETKAAEPGLLTLIVASTDGDVVTLTDGTSTETTVDPTGSDLVAGDELIVLETADNTMVATKEDGTNGWSWNDAPDGWSWND